MSSSLSPLPIPFIPPPFLTQLASLSRLRMEGASLYRTLGVSEDASYEEITSAAHLLEEKYATDIKKKIKITITREKIMELRLKQRVSGKISREERTRRIRSRNLATLLVVK